MFFSALGWELGAPLTMWAVVCVLFSHAVIEAEFCWRKPMTADLKGWNREQET